MWFKYGLKALARSFCPLPFPSAGDRWFRACCFWSFWAFSPYLNHIQKFSKKDRVKPSGTICV